MDLSGNIFEGRILGFFPFLLIRILKWYLHKMREYSKNEENMFDGDIYNIFSDLILPILIIEAYFFVFPLHQKFFLEPIPRLSRDQIRSFNLAIKGWIFFEGAFTLLHLINATLN